MARGVRTAQKAGTKATATKPAAKVPKKAKQVKQAKVAAYEMETSDEEIRGSDEEIRAPFALQKTIEKKKASKMIPSRAVLPKPDGKLRMKWTEEEDAALIKGMQKYKDTAWAKICADPEFGEVLQYRSNRDLKDRYVNLRKHDSYDFKAFDKIRADMKAKQQREFADAHDKRALNKQKAERERQQSELHALVARDDAKSVNKSSAKSKKTRAKK